MAGGAPTGNKNAAKAKVWAAAIERALEKRGGGDRIAALNELAEKLLIKCDEMDMSALKELGDRLDGKPSQTIDGEINHRGLAEAIVALGSASDT